MKTHLFAFVLAFLVLNSCGPAKNKEIMDSIDSAFTQIPTETFWELQTLEGKDVSRFTNNNQKVGFTLHKEDNKISGFAGCNNFFGTYKFETGNRIRFSSLGATAMACPDVAFNEHEFLKIFDLADNYTLDGNTLSLNVGRRAPLAIFKKVEKPIDGITEKYWKLKTLEGKEVKIGDNQEREVYFMLKNKDNRVTGFAGCNTIMGTYTLEDGNRIRFTQMATTKMTCPDIAFNESEFLEVFELADNYRITGDRLELNVGRRAPLAVFETVYFN